MVPLLLNWSAIIGYWCFPEFWYSLRVHSKAHSKKFSKSGVLAENYWITNHPGDKNSTESDFLVISENLRFFSIFPNFTISNAVEHDTKQVTVSNFEQTNTLLPRRQHCLSYEPLSGSNGFTLSRMHTCSPDQCWFRAFRRTKESN